MGGSVNYTRPSWDLLTTMVENCFPTVHYVQFSLMAVNYHSIIMRYAFVGMFFITYLFLQFVEEKYIIISKTYVVVGSMS